MDLRLANAKKVSEAVQKKLTKDLDDIGTMAKTIKTKPKKPSHFHRESNSPLREEAVSRNKAPLEPPRRKSYKI